MKYQFYRNLAAYWIAVWIAVFEGYFDPGTRARRNNNPGNLRGWDPDLPKDPQGFDIFPNAQAGFFALVRQVVKNIERNLTLYEFFAGSAEKGYPGYAPASDHNDPYGYAEFIAEKTQIPVANITIRQFIVDIAR